MNLEYPHGFPLDCQNLVEIEKIRADKEFRLTEQTQTLEQRALRWVCCVLGAFAHQACELCKAQQWTLAQVGAAVEEFRLDLVRKANYRMAEGRLEWVDRTFGTYIRPEVRREIENSEEWRRHWDELSQIIELQNQPANASPQISCTGCGSPFSTPESKQETGSRELRLQKFKTTHNANYADVMYSANVHKADFQKWRANKLKAESAMSQRIEDVLSGKLPFKRKLRQKRDE